MSESVTILAQGEEKDSSLALLNSPASLPSEIDEDCVAPVDPQKVRDEDDAMTSFRFPASFRPMFPLLIYVILSAAGPSMVFPLLPHQRDKYFHSESTSAVWKSLCESIGALIGFFLGGLFGLAADAYGRKPVLILSAFEASLAFAVHVAFGSRNPWPFMVMGNLCSAVGSTKVGNAAVGFMVIADLYEKNERLVPTIVYVVILFVGVAAAPIPSAFHLSDEATSIVAAVVLLVALLFVIFCFEETLPPAKRKRVSLRSLSNPLVPLRHIFRTRYFTSFALLAISFMFPFYLTSAIDIYYLDAKLGGFGTGDNGILMGIMAGCAIILLVGVLPLLARYFFPETIVLMSMISLLINGLLYCVVQRAYQAFALIPVTEAFSFVGMALMAQMVSAVVPRNEQGIVNGTLASVKELAIIAGPIAGSLLFSLGRYHLGGDPPKQLIELPFLLSMAVCAGGVGVVVLVLRPEMQKRRSVEAAAHSSAIGSSPAAGSSDTV